MNTRTKKKIALFVRYISRIGWLKGLTLYARLHVLQSLDNISFEGLKFPFRLRRGTTDLATFDQIFVSRIYNVPLNSPPQSIIDCGANVGMAAIYFANRFPESMIIAVEPEESNFEILEANCRPYPNIRCLQKAIWPFSTHLKVVDSGTGHYGFKTESVTVETGETKTVTASISIPEIMKSFGLTSVDFIKIDIEGAEKELFDEQTEAWLPFTRSFVVECHDRFRPGSSRSVIRAAAQYNFDVQCAHEGFFCSQSSPHP